MGANVANTRSDDETTRLLELISKAPKATTSTTPESESESEKPHNDRWKHKSMGVKSRGRVNRTKGK